MTMRGGELTMWGQVKLYHTNFAIIILDRIEMLGYVGRGGTRGKNEGQGWENLFGTSSA